MRVLAAAAAAAALLLPTTLASASARVPDALRAADALPTASLPASVTTAAPYVDGQVTLEVASLAPEVLTSEESLTITGSVTNGTDQQVSGAALVVQVQTRTEVSVGELGQWLAGERSTQVSQVRIEDPGAIAPGETREFTMTIPAQDLPLSDAEQWGPRGVEVLLAEGASTVAVDRTLMLWDPGALVQASRVTAVVPVAASGAQMTALLNASTLTGAQDADAAQEVAALRDRVTALLRLAREGVVLAVDPALLEALGLPLSEEDYAQLAETTPEPDPTASPGSEAEPTAQPSASPAASPSATSTDAASDVPKAADVDPALALLIARNELATALSQAIAAGDVILLPWQDADLAALSHLGENTLAASAFTRAQESAATLDGSLGTELSSGTTTALTTGPLDQATLSVLPETVTTVIAAPGDLPVAEDLFYTPSGTTTVEGRAVLVPDKDLSAAASGTVDGAALSELDARQLLRADSAVQVRQAPSMGRDVVVAVSREEASSEAVDVLDTRLSALLSTTWTQPQRLGSLVGSARQDETNGDQAQREPLDAFVSAGGEVTAEDLVAARSAEADVATLATVLSDPQAVTGDGSDVVAAAVSAAWRADSAGRSAYTAAVSGLRAAVAASLSPVPTSTINVIAESASMPVRVVSSLDQEVTVRVHLVPSSTRLQVAQDVEVTVPAQGEATVGVPITAVGSGEVTVSIDLLAADGTRVGTPVSILTRVHADWESMGTRVVAVLLALVLVVGIVRTVRRGRRRAVPSGTADPVGLAGSPGAAAATATGAADSQVTAGAEPRPGAETSGT